MTERHVKSPRSHLEGKSSTKVIDAYLSCWDDPDQTPNLHEFLRDHPLDESRSLADLVLIDQSRRWAKGVAPSAEEYLRAFPELGEDPALRMDVVYGEYRALFPRGNRRICEQLIERFPDLAECLQTQANLFELMQESDLDERLSPDASTITDLLPTIFVPKHSEVTSLHAAAPLRFSDYRLERELGAGAMGRVYQATQLSLGRSVAVKMLSDSTKNDRQLVERFLREARSIASLRHPNIVHVHGIGHNEVRGYFIVMDRVDGVDLETRLADGPLPLAEAVRIGIEVARALEHAHTRGIVHRDLKPSNVMLDASGNVVVTDFGLAKQMSGSELGMSSPGDIIGTPQYMAPEQVDQRWGVVGTAADIYGLGGLLYALLTGKPPVTGGSQFEVLCQVASAVEVPALRKLRPDASAMLETICAKCLHKRPVERYASAHEVEAALQTCSESKILCRDELPSRPRSLASPRQFVAWTACVVAAISLGTAWVNTQSGKGNRDVPRSSEHRIEESLDSTSITAVTASWSLELFQGKDRQNRHVITQNPMPIQTGDSLRLSLKYSRAIHSYIYWISADGTLSLLHPINHESDVPKEWIEIPSSADSAFPVVGDPGTEMCVVIMRDHPLDDFVSVPATYRPSSGFPRLNDKVVVVHGRDVIPIRSTNSAVAVEPASSANSRFLERLNDDSRALGPAEPLIDNEASRAILTWLSTLPDDLGRIECLAVSHENGLVLGHE